MYFFCLVLIFYSLYCGCKKKEKRKEKKKEKRKYNESECVVCLLFMNVFFFMIKLQE